jgi:CRP/FNR family transcriptional regulator, cyclic AMP receptor protein
MGHVHRQRSLSGYLDKDFAPLFLGPVYLARWIFTSDWEAGMEIGALGKEYLDGEIIIQQGESGECMYVIQEGQVEVIRELDDNRVRLAIRDQGDFIGEMAIFEREVRMATVRALGKARVLTIDKRNLLSRIHSDPSLAYRLVQSMSARIRELSVEIAQLRTEKGRTQSYSQD